MTSFYSLEELKELGFKSIGDQVQISKKASFYGIENIEIGNHVRIDDFCILSGNIILANYIHIAAATLLFAGNAQIKIDNFSTLSSRCAVYATSDDYSGVALTSPMLPAKYKNVINANVLIGRHCIIGTGSTILPGIILHEGCSIGAMSLINRDLEAWTIYAGIPCKKIKPRSRQLLELEQRFIKESF